MAATSNEDNGNPSLIDLRLDPIAMAVESGQVVERHWGFFKATFFPGMADEFAQATLLAWAGRKNIHAMFLTSYAAKSGALEISHVRFAKAS